MVVVVVDGGSSLCFCQLLKFPNNGKMLVFVSYIRAKSVGSGFYSMLRRYAVVVVE